MKDAARRRAERGGLPGPAERTLGPHHGFSRSRTNDECAETFLSGKHGLAMPSQQDRLQARTLDIANRLRFVCAHMESDELLELATSMARIELKYAGGLDLELPRRRTATG
jgi:hypothetical protein